jgi:hypothetical protein
MATEPRTIETCAEYAERRRRPRATGTVRDRQGRAGTSSRTSERCRPLHQCLRTTCSVEYTEPFGTVAR